MQSGAGQLGIAACVGSPQLEPRPGSWAPPLGWGLRLTRPLVFYRHLCWILSGAMVKPVILAAQELQAPKGRQELPTRVVAFDAVSGAEVRSPANLGSEFGCKLNFARTFFPQMGCPQSSALLRI